jgi:hypothetical protein
MTSVDNRAAARRSSFRVSARTLLHLGSELISSDSVAFYELIKNSLDAGSHSARIEIVVTIPYPRYNALLSDARGGSAREENVTTKKDRQSLSLEFVEHRARVLDAIDDAAPGAGLVRTLTTDAKTWGALVDAIVGANSITISDTGSGMSLRELNTTYLTIGTPERMKDREKWKTSVLDGSAPTGMRPVLGEKGVGRLSVMRLGNRLLVKTTKVGEANWNVLAIDWSQFADDPDDMIEDIEVEAELGPMKPSSAQSGTILRVTDLSGAWSLTQITNVLGVEFSKLSDPFSKRRLPVAVQFNGAGVPIPALDRTLFENAHATVDAAFVTGPKARISGHIVYFARGQRDRRATTDREETFSLDGDHLLNTAGVTLDDDNVTEDTLKSLGPFTLTLYWFNRQRLGAIDGIGNQKAVRDLLAGWSGGLMVFRDGFRVIPYGSPNDDWLDLDRLALASSGYKVNRRQVAGRVSISGAKNPELVDQTNREGLTDSTEKRVLVRLLKWIVEDQLRGFLTRVDDDFKAAASVTIGCRYRFAPVLPAEFC